MSLKKKSQLLCKVQALKNTEKQIFMMIWINNQFLIKCLRRRSYFQTMKNSTKNKNNAHI